MRIRIVLFFLILLSGCVKHPNIKNIDVVAVVKAAFEIYIQTTDVVFIPEEEIPEAIRKLNPVEVRVEATGVYITLDRLFSEESGLLISKPFGSMKSISGNFRGFPEIKRIQGITFTYVKG